MASLGVVEIIPESLEGGSATLVWPRGSFGHPHKAKRRKKNKKIA
jgi:hypothetical protein